jgi:hypothetical protein
MDLSTQALEILKLVLLGLLYLFFARVLWTVWTEVRRGDQRVGAQPHQQQVHAGPQPAPLAAELVDEYAATVAAGAPAGGRPGRVRGRRGDRVPKGRGGRVARLVVIEPKAKRGTAFPLVGELTVGRDPGSTIRIDDDTFVSQHHARFYDVDGQAMVEDLGSTNGSFHNGNRLIGSRLLRPGDRVQFGYTVLEAQ